MTVEFFKMISSRIYHYFTKLFRNKSVRCSYYRPHPKDGKGNIFTLFTRRRYPSPRFFPRSFLGYPSTGGGRGSLVLDRRYPGGVPPSQDLMGCPQPGQDWGTLLARSGWGIPQPGQDWGTPSQVRMGTPPPPQDCSTRWPLQDGNPLPLPRIEQQRNYLLRGVRYALAFTQEDFLVQSENNISSTF